MVATRLAAALTLILIASPVLAQHQHSHADTPPYAGLERRGIKALSEQQIADLKAGRGVGLALAAELNGYPGPIHVLELADRLGLDGKQRTQVRELTDAMMVETIPLGGRLIDQEAELDGMFATRQVTPAKLAAATDALGRTQGILRAAHLKYHLTTAALLSEEQIRQYDELRGYGDKGHAH